MNNLFDPADPGERGGTLCLFVVVIHRDDELFTYPSSAKIVPPYFALMVDCFVIWSVDVSQLRVIKWLEAMDEEIGQFVRSIEGMKEISE